MSNLPAILVANGLGAALMILLVFSNRKHVRNSFYDDRLFFSMCLIGAVMCVFEALSFYWDGETFPGARSITLTLNAMLFMGSSWCAFLWTAYVRYKLFGKESGFGSVSMIPALLVCFLSAVNLFFPVFFSISINNVYQRLPLAHLTYIVVYGYLLWGAGMVFHYRRKSGRYLFMPVVVFLTPIFIGSLIQFFCYGISLIWVSVAFGLTSLYINIQNETALLDPLTKLYNREYLTRYLNYITQRAEPAQFSGIMLDVNSFKAINDTYGHSVGDAALREVGALLSEAVRGRNIAARYGGDEFVIVSAGDEPEAQKLAQRIRDLAARYNREHQRPYELTMSMGTAVYDPDVDTLDTFLRRMDEKMYEEKRHHYSNAGYDRRRNRQER